MITAKVVPTEVLENLLDRIARPDRFSIFDPVLSDAS